MRYFYSFLVFLLGFQSTAQIRIGVISDLPPSETVNDLINSIVAEIDRTTGVNARVVTDDAYQTYNLASIAEAQAVYRSSKVDLFISIGGISTQALAQLSHLSTPVIGLGIIDHKLQEIPYINGRSGKDNFTYLLTSRDILKEIKSFKKITEFDQLTVVIDPAISKGIHPLQGAALLDSLEKELDVVITRVQANDDPLKTIQEIGVPQAVYLASLFGKDNKYISALSNHFIENKIPSFSSLKSHVDLGILASSSGDNSRQQIVRRMAILAADILSGQNAADMYVALNLNEDIFLNAATAKKLEFYPSFQLLLTVNLVGAMPSVEKTYSFNEIAEAALKNNFDLKISYNDIDLTALDVKSSRANILPYASSGITALQINEERANAAFNSPEQSVSLDLSLQQVVYSEEVFASIRINKYLKAAQEYQTQAEVLTVLLETYGVYLNVLSAKTNLDIQRKNLDNTRTNLELAKIRVNIGSSNNADLYRWQSEEAKAMQSVIEAQTTLLTVKLQLNNLLANTLEDQFEIADIGLDDPLFKDFSDSPIATLVKSPRELKNVADFLVNESLSQNPNKKQLLENINAAERQLQLNKRLFYMPTVAVQGQMSEILARGGEGSEPDPNMPAFGIGPQDNSWLVAANLTYPLFTGLNRQVEKQKSLVRLNQLENSNTSLDQALELGIRTGTLNLVSAASNLEYSRIAAESAEQNFELVQVNYKEGTVNITQLIDAQEAALAANLQSAIAIYEYIFANLQLEYSIGFFSPLLSEEEKSAFYSRFLQFLSEQ